MFKIFMTAAVALSFSSTVLADTLTLGCKVTGFKSDLDNSEIKDDEYLNSLAGAKTAVIKVIGQTAVLKLFNKDSEVIEFIKREYDPTAGKYKITKFQSATMGQYSTAGYEKRGEVAYANEDLVPLDDSYGAFFDLIFKKADLKRGTGTMNVRLWAASMSEPTDSVNSSPYLHTNWYLSCKAK